MPINKLGNHFFRSYDVNRWNNIALGRNIFTSKVLIKDKKLSEFINKTSMSALDNYAGHEKLSISITSLENDMFDDIKVSVFKHNLSDKSLFVMKIGEGKNAFGNFLKEIYTKVSETVAKKD